MLLQRIRGRPETLLPRQCLTLETFVPKISVLRVRILSSAPDRAWLLLGMHTGTDHSSQVELWGTARTGEVRGREAGVGAQVCLPNTLQVVGLTAQGCPAGQLPLSSLFGREK